MLLRELLLEAPRQVDQLEMMKSVLASKIKELPADDATVKALKEIEDLLKHVNAGGKLGIINGELASIQDESVTAAQKMLARYILSIDMTPDHRNELFTLWRGDKLVKHNILLGKGAKDFSQIITNYDSNPAIKELVNDLMRVAALGQGKGEFGLSVLSKKINKPEKGDLLIGNRKIEAKTTDGGAGRFTDQEVRPAEGFEMAARTLNDFCKSLKVPVPKSGLSLTQAVAMSVSLDSDKKQQAQFLKLVGNVIKIIFGGNESDSAAIKRIVDAVKAGNQGAALQEYAKASFNYYMSKKDDEGVLYINLTTDPISTVFFKDAEELAASKLRFHSGTVYITSIADVRLPYPQMEIIGTTFGANAAAKAAKVAAKADRASSRTQAAGKSVTKSAVKKTANLRTIK
jgi:hypothetical protein